MTFWDSSGIVPLLIREPASAVVQTLLQHDPAKMVWWGTDVECVSALARLRRDQHIDVREESALLLLLDTLQASWTEVLPSPRVRATARRLLRVRPLRAMDALQLAAALAWAGTADGHGLVSFDERLGLAARLEGFRVLPADS